MHAKRHNLLKNINIGGFLWPFGNIVSIQSPVISSGIVVPCLVLCTSWIEGSGQCFCFAFARHGRHPSSKVPYVHVHSWRLRDFHLQGGEQYTWKPDVWCVVSFGQLLSEILTLSSVGAGGLAWCSDGSKKLMLKALFCQNCLSWFSIFMRTGAVISTLLSKEKHEHRYIWMKFRRRKIPPLQVSHWASCKTTKLCGFHD